MDSQNNDTQQAFEQRLIEGNEDLKTQYHEYLKIKITGMQIERQMYLDNLKEIETGTPDKTKQSFDKSFSEF